MKEKKAKLDNVADAAVSAQETGGKTKKPRKALSIIINVVLVIAIIVAAISTYISFVSTSGNGVPSIFGFRFLSIQTDSMYPTLKPGDMIIDTPVKDTSELRPRDIITYWTVINGERVLNTHRIEQVYDGGGYLIFETKGDKNTTSDPLTVHESEIVGQYKVRIPGVGKVFDYLQTSTGFLVVVVIPVFIFFLYHLVQFFRVLFEYQNVKNRIKFEQEKAQNEELAEERNKDEERIALEAELREKLRAEILASMGVNNTAPEQAQPDENTSGTEENNDAAPEKAQPDENTSGTEENNDVAPEQAEPDENTSGAGENKDAAPEQVQPDENDSASKEQNAE